jgi:hypothetical protein
MSWTPYHSTPYDVNDIISPSSGHTAQCWQCQLLVTAGQWPLVLCTWLAMLTSVATVPSLPVMTTSVTAVHALRDP